MEHKRSLYWVELDCVEDGTEFYLCPTWNCEEAERKARQIWDDFNDDGKRRHEVYACGASVPEAMDAAKAFEKFKAANAWYAHYLLCLRYEDEDDDDDDDRYGSRFDSLYDDPSPETEAGWVFDDRLFMARRER